MPPTGHRYNMLYLWPGGALAEKKKESTLRQKDRPHQKLPKQMYFLGQANKCQACVFRDNGRLKHLKYKGNLKLFTVFLRSNRP